jgi:ACR3 family arsenite transporter
VTAGGLTRTALLKSHGKEWFETRFLPTFHPVMIGALVLTLVLIFAFQSKNLTSRFVAAPGALIGASNFFELAVAVAITLFGADSPAALARAVGVLVEVPVMLSVCSVCNRNAGMVWGKGLAWLARPAEWGLSAGDRVIWAP